ncbi:MAG: hypothetical protein Q3965_03795 [Rothia sp. (in: high G+C Gram-positive bacteria)]|nr:hypothetical protein [Rothia sp. (in: high G+C Gram-positive bacteria)]
MTESKPANVQKRDTTFKQEHGAVAHLVKSKPQQALARAIAGAQKLLDEGQGKQALNVLTLTKPVLSTERPGEMADYYQALGDIHTAMGAAKPAARAYAQAAGLDAARTEELAQKAEAQG